MFLNLSNHPSESWDEKQKNEARKYGDIVNMKFPEVLPYVSEEEIQKMADAVVSEVLRKKPEVVMCQGEFTLTYQIVKMLKSHNINVVSACSERMSREEKMTDGSVEKTSIFHFVRFRSY